MSIKHEGSQSDSSTLDQRLGEVEKFMRLSDTLREKGIMFGDDFSKLSPKEKSKALGELKMFISLAEKYWTEQGWLEKVD